jgi:hypothetical protein
MEILDDEAPSFVERCADRFLSATNTTSGFWWITLGFLAILAMVIAGCFFAIHNMFDNWPKMN